jgi:hypothetical protein
VEGRGQQPAADDVCGAVEDRGGEGVSAGLGGGVFSGGVGGRSAGWGWGGDWTEGDGGWGGVDKSGPTPTHRCSELDLLDATQQQDAQDACPRLGGVVVATCSTQGQIGVCKLVSEGAKQTIHFYEGGDVTAAEAEASCKKLLGTWRAS